MNMDKKFKGTYFISSISLTSAITEFGISSIFTLFLLYVLHFSTPLAANAFSDYYGFAYSLPILIGYISDKYLNKSETITIGFISMILSQFILSFSSSLYYPTNIEYNAYFFSLQNMTFAIGLFFLALGASFTNLSVPHIINSINNEKTSKQAFAIYYPILNLGVMIGVILTSVIIGEDCYYLYKWVFLLFGIILTIGLIAFHLLKNKYLVDNEGKLMKDEKSKFSLRNVAKTHIHKVSSKSTNENENLNLKEKMLMLIKSISPNEKDRIIVFLIFLIIIIIYRISYSQTSISMVFFIDAFVERDLNFYNVPVQLFCILNPLFILILGPLNIKFNKMLDEKNIEFGFIKKTIITLFIMTICFGMMSVLSYFLDIDTLDKINIIWILLFELFIAISELLFSVAGYSLVGDLVPERHYSFFFGLFIATRSVSMYFSGKLSTLFPENVTTSFHTNMPVNGLMNYFLIFVALNLITAFLLIVFRKKLKRKMHLDELTQ